MTHRPPAEGATASPLHDMAGDPAMRGAVPLDPDPEQRRTSKEFMAHVKDCAHCRTQGVDCADAAKIRAAWREAKSAARARRSAS